ncbi:hypothetical protein OS493_026904 [Desmophyllum pertusum]|uniref:Uncharacterized protein n=1 Tax=Desmophyllum pertusum TaxID=174260 RepID=A0A9W9ZBZ8_9CNID|nr:hypothetical protein OS493_026904 [Desmophyllum pertusum]
MSYVLQFQFHKAACEAAGYKGPLHTCSIYQSKAAGKKIGDMLKMGKSKPWPESLEKLTGSKSLDVGALAEYFEPLRIWMVKAARGTWIRATRVGRRRTIDGAHASKAGVTTPVPILFNTIAGLLFALVVFFR